MFPERLQLSQGIIFDFKKFSLHDGPGIRTTVFLKGCPLNCAWCHNPESISPKIEIHYQMERCFLCGECVSVCSNEALSFANQQLVRNLELCTCCSACVEACPAEAWQQVGQWMTVAQMMTEIRKDRVYYEESGGGVTFSGGEPLFQPDFLADALAACKAEGLHTAVDTTGFTAWKNLERIQKNTNLFLYDLKCMNSEKHRIFTGVPNEIILENLKSLVELGSSIIIRIPLIPGMNDDVQNIEETGQFLRKIGNVQQVDLLPYHNIALHKYEQMQKKYELRQVLPPSAEQIQAIQMKLESFGLKVKVGG